METEVKDTSLMALEKVNRRLEPDQQAVLGLLEEIGPAHDLRILEALNQKEQVTLKPRDLKRHWEINQVTARRNELVVKLGLVRDVGMFNGFWKDRAKTYHFWAVQGDDRQPAGWERLPDRPHMITVKNRCASCPFKKDALRRERERSILKRLHVSEAGSVLAHHRLSRRYQGTDTALLFG